MKTLFSCAHGKTGVRCDPGRLCLIKLIYLNKDWDCKVWISSCNAGRAGLQSSARSVLSAETFRLFPRRVRAVPPPRPCSKLGAPDTHPAGPCLVLLQPERTQIATLQGDCSRLHWVGLLGSKQTMAQAPGGQSRTHARGSPGDSESYPSAPSFARTLWPSARALRLPGRSGPSWWTLGSV